MKRTLSTRRFPPARLAAFVSLFLIAYALRSHGLERFSFWIDEGLTPLRAGFSLPAILSNEIPIQDAVTQDTHPPLYFLLIHLTRAAFGPSDFAYRYVSVLAGLLLVPVLYQLGRALAGRRVGALAALFTAASPLYIWYSQEARMYTLLALWGALAGYLLWRAVDERRVHPGRLAAYLLVAALALYTHYAAVFLIGAHALFWLWLLWQAGYRRLILGAGLAAALLAVPLIPYTVPRLFSGAEANFRYVAPTIMFRDVFHGFGLGLTAPSDGWTSAAVLIIFLLSGLGLWSVRRLAPRAARPAALFLLSYLFVTVLGLAAGSLLKPLYQGVRHTLIGSPALLLLLALGVDDLARRRPPAVGRLAGALGLFLLLVAFGRSLVHFYTDDAFAKDDVRGLVRYVEAHAGQGDAVVYTDAVLMLLHRHYGRRPDLHITTLPIYPHGYSDETTDRLQALGDAVDRIWLVPTMVAEPPTRDPAGTVARRLRESLPLLLARPFTAVNSNLRVEAYSTAAPTVAALPPGAQPADVAWSGLPTLVGADIVGARPLAAPALWIDLFWRGAAPHEDQRLRFNLRGPEGWTWVEDNRPLLSETAGAWSPAALHRLRYGIALPAGLPPGRYELALLGWDARHGQAGDAWASLGAVMVGDPDPWPIRPSTPPAAAVTFDNAITLRLAEPSGTVVRPGQSVPLDLLWRRRPGASAERATALTFDVALLAPDGAVVDERQGVPGPDWLAAPWPLDVDLRDPVVVRVPARAAPGDYRLRWTLRDGDEIIPGRPRLRPWSTASVIHGHVAVTAWPLRSDLPDIEQPLEAALGDLAHLRGYAATVGEESLAVTLVWQVDTAVDENYFTFVHLVDPADGHVVSQVDWVALDGQRPTFTWRPGEVLVDPYRLPLADVAPGDYALYVGLFRPDDGARLPIVVDGVAQPDDRLRLATVTIP